MVDNSIISEINEALNEKDTSSGVQAIKEIFDKKNIKMKTRLRGQVNENFHFARLIVIGKKLNNDTINNYCEEELELRVSIDGKGREEAVDISRGQPAPVDTRSGLAKFLGW